MRDRLHSSSLGRTVAESFQNSDRAAASQRPRPQRKGSAPEMAIAEYKENAPTLSESKVVKSLSAPDKVGSETSRWPCRSDFGLGSKDISNCLHDVHSPEKEKKSRTWSLTRRSPWRQKGPQSSPSNNAKCPQSSPSNAMRGPQSSPSNAVREEVVEAPSWSCPASSPSRSSCCQTEVIVLHGSPVDHAPIDCRTELQMLNEALTTPGIQLKIGTANTDSLTHVLTCAQSCEHVVLYLSAHGIRAKSNNVGLGLEKLDGMVHILWIDQLDELLSAHEAELGKVFLVFLSACSSEEFAQVFIERGCRHVIAVRGDVLDTVAMKFAQVFFTSLASGASILKAFNAARVRLRLDPDAAVQVAAERYVLFGQHTADKETLCDTRESLFEELGFRRVNLDSCFLEDAKTCLVVDLPSPHPYFVGRNEYMHGILECFKRHRACVVYGRQGMGKCTLGQEFARYASAPGRFFSCCATIVEPEGLTVETLVGAVSRKLLGLVHQHLGEVPEHTVDLQALQAETLIQMLEQSRRRAILIVIHDRAGIVSGSDVARTLLGQIIEKTQRAYFLICSPEPVHGLLSSRKANNIFLCNLSNLESARLFLKYVHRSLTAADFGGQPPPESFADLTLLLSEHVLLRKLAGNPRKICEVATGLVVPRGPTLLDIAATFYAGAPAPINVSTVMP